MVFLRTLFRSSHFHRLKLQNASRYANSPHAHTPFSTIHALIPNYYEISVLSSICQRPICLLAQLEQETDTGSIHSDNIEEHGKKRTKKALDILFKEAVGLAEKTAHSDDTESESESESESEKNELKKKLKKLEVELRTLKAKKAHNLKEKQERENLKEKPEIDNLESKIEPKSKSLYAMFTLKDVGSRGKLGEFDTMRREDTKVYKELSPEMGLFVRHLYDGGYFNKANFLPRYKFDVTFFENSYGRDFIKFAAEKFGKDNQEIAKWLSGSDLKKVALFGCPSLDRKNVFSAKRLRTFFSIQEDTVCSKCVLKRSCKFVNQSVWRGDTKTLNLAVVMRVITLYALGSVPPQLVVPDEVNTSVGRLLNEVASLSKTLS